MTEQSRPRALLIQLEFPTWAAARAWTYSAGYAIEEGLAANGVECVTIPAVVGTPSSSPESWLFHAKQWLQGQRFDQMWVWLVHTPLDETCLAWLSTLAPIRVGVLMESLQYEDEDYRHVPQLKGRAALVERQIGYMTHVLAPDELDADSLNARHGTRALWWPPVVPSRAIAATTAMASQRRAVFHGTPYGARQRWISEPTLSEVMAFEGPANPPTYHQALFDRLQVAAAQFLRSGQPVTAAKCHEYASGLQGLRAEEFSEWMTGLAQWPAIVNLPSLAKFYGGRVFEGMAAGLPVVSWEIPHRPRNRALFKDGREIVLFDKDDVPGLVSRLKCLLPDEAHRRSVAARAQERVRSFHTAERRLHDTLTWIGSGVEPTYGLHSFEPASGAEDGVSTTVRSAATPAAVESPGKHVASEHTDSFYEKLFIETPHWSTPHPNPDEAARWSKIAGFLELIRRRMGNRSIRVVEVGCGRGWLTNLVATYYGSCEGVEPVVGVVERARQLFPMLRFTAGTAATLREQVDFQPYDVVISSEVLEHVPYGDQAAFLESLRALLTPGGYVILTTPRGDVREQWQRIAPPNQPIEDWVTERQLHALWEGAGMQCLGLERVCVEVPSLRFVPAPTPEEIRTLNLMPIYQIWACQWPAERNTLAPLMNQPPTVSVIVPTYNRPDRLREALQSILAQTFQDVEIIVVNDGDTDVSSVIDGLPHGGRITYVKHDRNKGLAASRNTGLRLARGTYVAYLDDDDRYYPDHLAVLVNALQQGAFQVAYTDAWRAIEDCTGDQRCVVQRDLPYSYDFNPARLLVTNYFPVLCVMHARACLDEVGMFDETLFAHEDWDLWIRLATKYPFLHIKQTTAEFSWRTDGSSMTSGSKESYLRTTEIIYRKYRPHAERMPGVIEAQQHELSIRQRDLGRTAVSCSIVIPVWNRRDLTEQCLVTLAAVTDGCDYEVILVDNGSSDTTPELLKTLSGDVRIVRNEQNLGFAMACNQGAKMARGKYLVFLNNDTIPLKGWLSALVQEVESSAEITVVGSKLLYEDGTIQHGGVAFSWLYGTAYHLYTRVPADASMVSRRRELQAVTGACMLVRRTAFEAAGGFDEGFCNGFEDVDICLKIRDQGGRVVYQPKSVLYHLESQTPGRKAHEKENVKRFLARWSSHWWLPDEYMLYAEDGLACRMWKDHDMWQDRVVPFGNASERVQWEYVATVQRLTHRRDPAALGEIRKHLAHPEAWPDDSQALRWGAFVCRHAGAPEYAGAFWRRLLGLEEAFEARMALAGQAIEEGHLEDAETHIQALINSEHHDGEGWLLRGVWSMQRHAYAAAIQAFETAFNRGGDPRKCRMGRGMAAMGCDTPVDAWESFQSVLKDWPDDQEAIHWLLRAGTVLQYWRPLCEALERFVKRNAGDLSVRYALAGVALRLGRHDVARAQYDTIQVLNPAFDGLPELEKTLMRHHICTGPHAES